MLQLAIVITRSGAQKKNKQKICLLHCLIPFQYIFLESIGVLKCYLFLVLPSGRFPLFSITEILYSLVTPPFNLGFSHLIICEIK